MQIDIDRVSFKVFDNRWLEIHVGDAEIVTVDTWDGGVTLGEGCREELGNFEEVDGAVDFVPAGDEEEPEKESEQEGGFRVVYVQPVFDRILEVLERIEKKL